MRVLALLAVLGGCYRPTTAADCAVRCGADLACPDDLACTNGFCTSGAVCLVDDARPPDDGPPPCAIMDSFGLSSVLDLPALPDRGAYTFDVGRTLATFDYQTSSNEVRSGPVDDDTTRTLVISNNPGAEYQMPRLSPEGTELFARQVGPAGVTFVVIPRGDGASWGMAIPITVYDDTLIVLSVNDYLGTPTHRDAGPQRHMMMQRDDEFWELAESETIPGRWDFVGSFATTSFGLDLIQFPQLSPDGLRLVFSGKVGAAPLAVYATSRPTIGQAWIPSTIVVQTAAPRHPFLSADCQQIYVHSSGSFVERWQAGQ